MNRIIYLSLFFLFLINKLDSQTVGTVSTTIGDNFISGVSPVNNTITANDPNANWIDFYLADPSFTMIYDSLIDNTGGNATRSWTYNMGSLDTGMVVWALFYDNTGTYYGYNYYYPNMIPMPQWMLDGGFVSGVNVVGNSVLMTGHLPLLTTPNTIQNVPGLSGRQYSLGAAEITFNNVDFDCGTGNTNTIVNPQLTYDLNILGQMTVPISYPITYMGQCFQPDFNLVLDDSTTTGSLQIANINWPSMSFPVPGVPLLKIKLDGGLNIAGELKGKLVYGWDSNVGAYGFIGNGLDTTRVTAKIDADAFLRVRADAIIAEASGTVYAAGSIGGGFSYASFRPQPFNPLFGYDLQIGGAIDFRLGPNIPWLSVTKHYETTFYNNQWGDQLRLNPFYQRVYDNVDAMGNYTSIVQSNPSFIVPTFYSQPNMSANDSALYIVWLDTNATNTTILFSILNYQTGFFSTPDLVTSGEVISNPKVSMLPSGNALITWTQNRYTAATFDTTTMDLTDLLQAQDIWVTLYNKASNTFDIPIMLSDVNAGPQTGRAEGNANIIMGKGQYGLITWVVNNDTTNQNSDVYYCTVEEVGNNVFLGAPTQLINLSGTNTSINVAYYDSTHAIASWINDPDGLDSTLDNEVEQMDWTQTSQTTGFWGAPAPLVVNNGWFSFDDVSIDFNGDYGAISFTTTEYDANGNFQKGIYADAWDSQIQDWAPISYAIDSFFTFSQPKVSVNRNGYVALTYQSVLTFDDITNPDNGQLNLYLNDSQNDPSTWFTNNGNQLLGDSSVYDWDLNTTYGDQDNFYIVTQEADTITGNAPLNPPNGVRFGNTYLNLVIRALALTPTVITDIPEPSTQATFTKYNSFDFNLYPNPVSSNATIEYSLDNASEVSVEIYTLSGQLVATVFEGHQGAGSYKAIYEPNGITNGIYLCRVTANDQSAVKKMVIAR
ncbi:MAG: T9SS type A sorting domain-containing protein [Bacteroidia bacterium]